MALISTLQGTMAIDNTEVSMVWGSLALGSDAAPGMTTNYHFQGERLKNNVYPLVQYNSCGEATQRGRGGGGLRIVFLQGQLCTERALFGNHSQGRVSLKVVRWGTPLPCFSRSLTCAARVVATILRTHCRAANPLALRTGFCCGCVCVCVLHARFMCVLGANENRDLHKPKLFFATKNAKPPTPTPTPPQKQKQVCFSTTTDSCLPWLGSWETR